MTVRLWDTARGALVRTLEGHTASVTQLDFSPDGSRLVSASLDHSVKVWTTAGRNILSLDNYPADITGLTFSADGAWLLTGLTDKTIRIQ